MLSRLAVRQDGQNLRGKRSAGLNAENSSAPRPKAKCFLLTFLFIGRPIIRLSSLPEDAAEERDCLSKLPASMLSFVGSDNEAYPNDDHPHRIGGPIKGPYHETAGFHVLDVGTNYFGLWTEADNIRR